MENIDRAIQVVAEAEAIIVSAGAGMGVDSGLPDYRGKDGFWNHYPMYRELGMDYQKATRPSGFLKDPGLAWGFYGHCLNLYRSAVPHQGFGALLAIGSEKPCGYFVFTSNIDGQFQKAGFRADRIHECHGSIHRLQCIHPCCLLTWPADGIRVEVDPKTMRAAPPFPKCPYCGAIARPNLFAFGDTAFVHEQYTAQAAAFATWRQGLQSRKTAVIECGAGTTVPGIRRFGEELCETLEHATLIRINPTEPQSRISDAIALQSTASSALRLLAEGRS